MSRCKEVLLIIYDLLTQENETSLLKVITSYHHSCLWKAFLL